VKYPLRIEGDQRGSLKAPPPKSGCPGSVPETYATSIQERVKTKDMSSSTRSFQCEDHSIDEPRPIRVVIIGAGPCGLVCAIRLKQRIKNVSICVYDQNADVGGTWYENRYPGVGCDIPTMSYQLTFEPNREWSSIYPSGAEIGVYWKHVAKKYQIYEHVQLCHRVCETEWDDCAGKWVVKVEDLASGTVTDDQCDILLSCMGAFNNWRWPDIPGRESYKGEIMHSAAWNEKFDFKGKKVALIGSGSSAVQILPNLQPIVGQLDDYVRNQMWLSPRFGADYALERNPELADTNFVLTEEMRRRFKDDDKYYWTYRKEMERRMNSLHGFTLVNHPLQNVFREYMAKEMTEKLSTRPDILAHILPTFPPGCRRVTPDAGYMEALMKDNVSFINTEIAQFTHDGIKTVDGKNHQYDAIVCATGFDCSFRPRFPFIGRNGVDLRDKFNEKADSYFSLAVDGFPNMMIMAGPNSEVGTSHSMIVFEKLGDYVVKIVEKIQFERIKSMQPSTRAVGDFAKFLDTYFDDKRTVYGQKCRSAYRNGKEDGRNVALWPGSVLHLIRTLQHPRWQDYDYEYLNEENIFGYLGDGWTEIEKSEDGDRAYYLDEIDFPSSAGNFEMLAVEGNKV
jgi:cation diffusion facilitator CzcD-associated flavoprotein CzcO